ncbi:MAG TPA: HAMP domain-containing methyl-accepting chemotaxis protein [Thermodesulfovibrio thiophilus]|uniref:methyl-accepting chemotaxis protein n=1 Tax=Thermodesulfovibrio thiophilus TaxID=340095 RepID=UPI00040C8BD3|nr:HAMP domain-containing methyl-accepting chemotaxis protein [Thermodesulfovibrio thiophilus]HOA82958.1 HAMP domain-containing methyl-accepting chemotaxis protein [Thermodesulfovibrio thiophilus]HQA03705.1 HAMP domain-containing methyl-accepting chemotaxis protein [Thermodesulfovibrio thiophilus]
MFKNLTIGKKLGIGFGVLIFLLLIFGGVTIIQLGIIKKNATDIDERIDKVNNSVGIRRAAIAIFSSVRDMLIIDDMKKKEEAKKSIEENRAKYKELIEAIKKITYTKEGMTLLQNIEEALKDAAHYNNQVIELVMAGKKQEAIALYYKEVNPRIVKLEKTLDEEVIFQRKGLNASLNEMNNVIKKETVTVVILTVSGLIFGVFSATLISRSISKPVAELKDALERIGQGDLTVEIKAESKDEIGVISNSLTQAIVSIKNLIGQSKTISSSLASSSEQLSATTEEISRNLKSQTERASQIASAAEEMSQTVVDIAKNASNIAEVSVTTANVAKEGKDMTINTAEEIKIIEDSVNKLSGIVNDLGERSRQIGEIVTVIKDIADQTNLLALNAAIEAARAGEQGRGFAVVADEVRKLAERTAKATDEIADMITRIQTEVNVAEQSMEDATKKVASGVELSEKAANTLTQILNKAQELQSMIQQIASATEEMSSVTDHITQDIGGIAEGSKEISVAVDQSAQTASDIARLGGELNAAIGRFKV